MTNHKWTALAEPGRGCAVLNDCKYGVSVDGQEIRLTLLKAAMAPDMTADRGQQVFTYAFTAWDGPLSESALQREAYELNTAVTLRCWGRRNPLAPADRSSGRDRRYGQAR